MCTGFSFVALSYPVLAFGLEEKALECLHPVLRESFLASRMNAYDTGAAEHRHPQEQVVTRSSMQGQSCSVLGAGPM